MKNCNLIHATMDEPHTSPGNQGSSAPGPQTATGPWPVRNWAAQKVMRARYQAKLHLRLHLLPIAHIPWSVEKKGLPRNRSLVAKKLGTTDTEI